MFLPPAHACVFVYPPLVVIHYLNLDLWWQTTNSILFIVFQFLKFWHIFQSGQILNEGGRSVISYSPKTELDYGTLLCWARNNVGLGSPCVFTILPIGPQEPPAKCRTSNVTYSSFEVDPCIHLVYNINKGRNILLPVKFA